MNKCLICGIEYIPKNKNSKYCSSKCTGISQNKQIIKKCIICNKEFKTSLYRKDTAKYCSQECQHKSLIKMSNCLFCDKEFYSENKKKKFCSNECRLKYGRVEVICDCCGVHFFRKKHQYNENAQYQYCSKKCRDEHRKTFLNGENSIFYLRVKTYCAYCGKEISIIPSLISNDNNYCDRECMSNYYKENYTGKNSWNYTGGKINYYGFNWLQQRRLARERDNYTCQNCEITEKEYGQELSVHHIKRFRDFETWEEANQLDNLICLCEPCHKIIGMTNSKRYSPNLCESIRGSETTLEHIK